MCASHSPTPRWDQTRYAWKRDVDYRACPEKYRVGKGEQGVLICEPYKSELLPLCASKLRRSQNRVARPSTRAS